MAEVGQGRTLSGDLCTMFCIFLEFHFTGGVDKIAEESTQNTSLPFVSIVHNSIFFISYWFSGVCKVTY